MRYTTSVSVLLLFLALCIAVLGYGVFEHKRATALEERVLLLERAVLGLAGVTQALDSAKDETRAHLSELINRGGVFARSQEELLTEVVRATTPAVVSLVVSRDVPLLEVEYVNPFGNDPFFRDFGVRVPRYRQVGTESRRVGSGTGFFIRSDGYLLTNRHVVDEPEATYVALLSDGRQLDATVVYRDGANDLAILKVAGSGFPTVSLGDSSALALGQTVVAIGNALGEYTNSVSVGIVSGLERTIEARDARGGVTRLSGVIQTDAAINQGNSGGPLLSLSGEVIGINVAMQMGAQNIGFAIPARVAQTLIEEVILD